MWLYSITATAEEWFRADLVSLQDKNKMPRRDVTLLERIMFTTGPVF